MENYFTPENYSSVYNINKFFNKIIIEDHIGGFDNDFRNPILDHISKSVTEQTTVMTYYMFNDSVKHNYPNLTFKSDQIYYPRLLQSFQDYNCHPEINFKNFLCSFNGTNHVSRKLLVSALQKFRHFNPEYCSKNFVFTSDTLDGHIRDYVADNNNFYRKFFIADHSEEFFQTVHSFGHVQYDHPRNIYNLEHKLTQSFLHIVSETMATNCHAFISEKSFYSIVTRGLFLSYAQAGWHEYLEKYLGFKRYTKLFDYTFDAIQNPVERLVELMTMISKFSILSPDDWRDLYLIEQDTIEYNYHHYFSGNYMQHLKQYG